MEKEGLERKRSMEYLSAVDLHVGTIITDRHPQIQKWVRETMAKEENLHPGVTHYYDPWHICKGKYFISLSLKGYILHSTLR